MADTQKKTEAKKATESSGSSTDSTKEPTTETEIKQASATGGVQNTGPVMNGPSQDDLNPAYAPPQEDAPQKDRQEESDGK
jgi:hypothetical protein